MKILLTNDDGVRADGMGVMRRIAAELSDDVWVCACLIAQPCEFTKTR